MRSDSVPDAVPAALARRLPGEATIVAVAPGRANLIGEHTDYNEGLVLPVALELRTVVAGKPAARIRLRSGGGPTVEVDPRTGKGPTTGWGRYITAVVRALLETGRRPRGIDGVIESEVPAGTGLSSSAALEVAVALAVLAEPIAPLELARVCQRAENVHVGVQSGVMDQLVSIAAQAGSALSLDCRSLATEHVPMPDDLRILVVDSGRRRRLADGGYNRRRAECEEAAERIGAGSLREVSAEQLASADLPAPLAGRARHVVGENARVLDTVAALRADDRRRLGLLWAASHASLRDDFAVSTPELDALVEIATSTPGVVAARMTGAGFGGCTVNLVETGRSEEAALAIADAYRSRVDRAASWWISRPASGAFALAPS